MLAKITSALNALSIATWRINWNHTQTEELFFIRRGADMHRTADYTEAYVTVYHDFTVGEKKMRGSSQVNVYPGMEDAALTTALKEAYAAAAHVKNLYYDLPDPVVDHRESAQTVNLSQAARELADAIFSVDVQPKAFVNSCEVFAVRKENRVLASNGTDVFYTQYDYNGEFVVQCEQPQDVELHRSFRYATPDAQSLRADVEEALTTVQDRAAATQMPLAGTYTCVISGRNLESILENYGQKASTNMIYSRYSQYKVGQSVQGEDVVGEKLNITLGNKAPYSEEGIPMPGIELVREGTLLDLHGDTRFCRYLDLEPKGRYSSMRVDNGTQPLQTLLQAPCIHPVAFSDFQMDPLSGRFGGEIRLAYVYDETGVHTVTGGSISGSLLEMQADMVFSKERYVSAEYDGPMAVRLKNVSVAGRDA